MTMYPKLNLYNYYLDYSCRDNPLPDVTNRATMEWINRAINICDSWNNFMDIGGGDGKNAVALSEKFKKGTLVEIEIMEEHKNIKKSSTNLNIFNDLIENYRPSGDKFDFILLADVFEHIPEIEQFIKQISELQSDYGVIYVMTPNPIFCGSAPESEIFHTKKQHGHIKHYTAQEISRLMKIYGYEMIFISYEESTMRRMMKLFIKAIARRDIRWRKNISYKLMRPIALPILRSLYKIIEIVVHKNEIKNSTNPFSTITQNLAFKKIACLNK